MKARNWTSAPCATILSAYRRLPFQVLLFLALSFAVAHDSFANEQLGYLLYVSNEDSNDVSVIDPLRNEVIATIGVGKRPRGIRVSADGQHIFVALSGSPKCPPTMPDEECAALAIDKSQDGIAMVDAHSRRIIRVLPGGSDPEQFDLSPDSKRLFVSNEDADSASIVDVATGRVLKTVAVGREPEGVKTSPDGSVFVVTSESDHDIAIVDAQTGEVATRVEIGLRPRDVIFTSDGRRAFVSAELSRHVAVLDTTTWRVLSTISISETALPMGLAVSEDSLTLYVANGRERTASKIDLDRSAVVASVEAGTRPWGVLLSPDGTRLYTANGPSNDVSVIDTATMTVIGKIAVGSSPWGIAAGRVSESGRH